MCEFENFRMWKTRENRFVNSFPASRSNIVANFQNKNIKQFSSKLWQFGNFLLLRSVVFVQLYGCLLQFPIK